MKDLLHMVALFFLLACRFDSIALGGDLTVMLLNYESLSENITPFYHCRACFGGRGGTQVRLYQLASVYDRHVNADFLS